MSWQTMWLEEKRTVIGGSISAGVGVLLIVLVALSWIHVAFIALGILFLFIGMVAVYATFSGSDFPPDGGV